VRVEVSDIRHLHEVAPFAWSRYGLTQQNGVTVFTQHVSGVGTEAGTLKNVGWDGSEVVAFRLHLPSKVRWHNSRSLETNERSTSARGNILGWEQHLADRLDGQPLDVRVEMESQSILYRTLFLFGGAFLAAVALLGSLIWWTVRKGAARRPPAPSTRVGQAPMTMRAPSGPGCACRPSPTVTFVAPLFACSRNSGSNHSPCSTSSTATTR